MAKKTVIASGKGGVGKSTLTAGLSNALVGLGKSVLAVDFDIGLRSLDLILGVREQVVFDWGDLILKRCELQQAMIKSPGGTVFIAAPLTFNRAFNFRNIKELLKSVDQHFDYIFLDSPAGISRGFQLAACAADAGLIIATPDEVCVHSGAKAADEMLDMGIANPRLIINRFNKKAVFKGRLLNIDDVIDAAGVQLIGVVPEDCELSYCAGSGQLLPKTTPSAYALNRIVRRLEGENLPLKL